MAKTKSVLTNSDNCYVCGRKQVEEHHIFFGLRNRKKSEELGYKVYLCSEHHRGSPNGVHSNRELDLKLKRLAQEHYEKTHTREEFIKLFGKSYILD